MHTHELRFEPRSPISPLHSCESIAACIKTREWEHLFQAWRRGRALLSKMHSLHHHRASARATVLMTAVLVRRFQTCRTLVRRVARRGGSHTRVPSCNSHASLRASLVVRFSAPPRPCHYVSPGLPSRHRCDPRPHSIHRSNRSPTVSPNRCTCRRGHSSSAVLVRISPLSGGGWRVHVTRLRHTFEWTSRACVEESARRRMLRRTTLR